MKVLLVGKFYQEAFASHISKNLAAMGHEVVHFEVGAVLATNSSILTKRLFQIRLVTAELTRQTNIGSMMYTAKVLARMTDKLPVDLVIVCHDFLEPVLVRKIKSISKAPVVLWFPDALSVWGKHMFLNAPYDFLFLKDPYQVQILRRCLSKNVYYLPECFSTFSLTQENIVLDEGEYECDITTAGNMYSYRCAFFEELSQLNYRIKIWGNPRPSWMLSEKIDSMMMNKYVSDGEKVQAFRSAKVVLNNLHPAEICGINARAFEIAGAQAFQLIDWRSGLEQLFEDGKELVAFKNLDDLKIKIRHYVNEKEERRDIAGRGNDRALAEHTYYHRLDLLIKTVFSGAKGFPLR